SGRRSAWASAGMDHTDCAQARRAIAISCNFDMTNTSQPIACNADAQAAAQFPNNPVHLVPPRAGVARYFGVRPPPRGWPITPSAPKSLGERLVRTSWLSLTINRQRRSLPRPINVNGVVSRLFVGTTILP